MEQEHVTTLLNMAFENIDEITHALLFSRNDINEAVAILTNEHATYNLRSEDVEMKDAPTSQALVPCVAPPSYETMVEDQVMRLIDDSSSMRFSKIAVDTYSLLSWLAENKVLSIAMEGNIDNIDQVEYSNKIKGIIEFVGHRLSLDELSKIWNMQNGKSAQIVDNIHAIMYAASSKFNEEQFDHLVCLIQETWKGGNDQMRKRLIAFIGRIGKETNQGKMSTKILNLLWELAHSTEIPTSLVEQVITEFIIIEAPHKYLITKWYIVRCIEDVCKGEKVLLSLKLLHNLCKNILKSNKAALNQINKDHAITEIITASLGRCHKKTVNVLGVGQLSPIVFVDGRYTHKEYVEEHLNCLKFILEEGSQYLTRNQAKLIWNTLVKNPNSCDYDKKVCFEWFVNCPQDIETDSQSLLFQPKRLKLDPSLITCQGLHLPSSSTMFHTLELPRTNPTSSSDILAPTTSSYRTEGNVNISEINDDWEYFERAKELPNWTRKYSYPSEYTRSTEDHLKVTRIDETVIILNCIYPDWFAMKNYLASRFGIKSRVEVRKHVCIKCDTTSDARSVAAILSKKTHTLLKYIMQKQKQIYLRKIQMSRMFNFLDEEPSFTATSSWPYVLNLLRNHPDEDERNLLLDMPRYDQYEVYRGLQSEYIKEAMEDEFGYSGPAPTSTSGFLHGMPSTSVGNSGGGAPPLPAAATTIGSLFSSTPSSTFSGLGAPTATSGSTNMFGFGICNNPPGGFCVVSTQPSSTSSAFTFGTPKTTTSVIVPAFGFDASTNTLAATTTVAPNTTGTLTFGTPSFGSTGFAFSTNPASTTATNTTTMAFACATPTTAAGTSMFAPSEITCASILNLPRPFNQGTTTTTMSSATTSALREYTTVANELTPSDSGMESYQNASLSPMGDLRHLLKKKRNVPEKEKLTEEPCTKRIISFKKSAAASEDLSEVVCVVKKQSRNKDDIGFRVKTLGEIRREKETKQGLGGKTAAEIPEEENDVSKPNTNLSYLVRGHAVENKVKPEGSKRKLCGKPLELYKPALKERNDMEENESVLEHYAAQVAENSMSDGEDGAKNISHKIIPQKEEKPFSSSLKRVCDSDMPIASKIRKTAALQRVPLQNLSASGTGEEKPSRLVAESQKNGNSLTFKRHNIICRNIFNDLSSIQSNAMDEDFSSQLQTSDSQKELSLQTSELNVSSSQNGACMDSDDFHEKTEDIEMSEEKANNANLSRKQD